MGMVALGLYSYDSRNADSLSSSAKCRYGYEGISSYDESTGQYTYDAIVANGVSKAVRDFGKPLP